MMNSYYQRLSLFILYVSQLLSEAIFREEFEILIDLGIVNIAAEQVFNHAREVRNPLNGETLYRAGSPARFRFNQQISSRSSALEAFITARRRADVKNDILSEKYEAINYQLRCPILLDFPLIPVIFNGRLYDYDSLMRLAQGEFIKDPTTREIIKLAPHVIQPDFRAQEQMDRLIAEMNNNNRQTP